MVWNMVWRWRRFLGFLAVLSLVLGLAGCASAPAPTDGASWQEQQTARLSVRAQARWDAVIKGELDKAYLFLSPEYRSVVSLQQYKAKYGRTLEWRMAQTERIRYDDPNVASVFMGVSYRTYLPGAKGELFESKKILTEKWLYKDGEWWYTDQ